MGSTVRVGWRCCVAAGLALAASGCKVVSIDEDRAMRERSSGSFDAASYVDRSWDSRLVPDLAGSAVELGGLAPKLRGDLEAAGSAHGRKGAEGADWTFLVEGEGAVMAIDTQSPVGTLTLAVPGAGDVRLFTGPVLVSTALRDAVPSLRFDDFADQMAFAAVNKALNDKALGTVRGAVRGLRVGDRVRFVGAMHMASAGDPLEVVPVRLEPAGAS